MSKQNLIAQGAVAVTVIEWITSKLHGNDILLNTTCIMLEFHITPPEIYNVSNIRFVPDLSDQEKKKSGRHMLDRYLLWITLYLSLSIA